MGCLIIDPPFWGAPIDGNLHLPNIPKPSPVSYLAYVCPSGCVLGWYSETYSWFILSFQCLFNPEHFLVGSECGELKRIFVSIEKGTPYSTAAQATSFS